MDDQKKGIASWFSGLLGGKKEEVVEETPVVEDVVEEAPVVEETPVVEEEKQEPIA